MRLIKATLLSLLLIVAINGRVLQGVQPPQVTQAVVPAFASVSCDNFFVAKLKNLEKWKGIFLDNSVAPKESEEMCKSVWASNKGSCCNVDKIKEIAEKNMLSSASSTKRFIEKLGKLKNFFTNNKSKLLKEITSLEKKIGDRKSRREKRRGGNKNRILQHIKFDKSKVDEWGEEEKKKIEEFKKKEENRYKKKENPDVNWEREDDNNLAKFKKNVEMLTTLLNGKFEDLEKKYKENVKTCTDFSQNFKAGTLCYLCSGNANEFLSNSGTGLLVKITKDSCSQLASSCSWAWNFNFKVNLGLRSYYYLKHALKSRSPVEWYPKDKYSRFDDEGYALSGDMDRVLELMGKTDDVSKTELATTEAKICTGLFKAFGTNTVIEGEIEDVEKAEEIITETIEDDEPEQTQTPATPKVVSTRVLQSAADFEGSIIIVEGTASGLKPEVSKAGLMLDTDFIATQGTTPSGSPLIVASFIQVFAVFIAILFN